MVKLFDDLPEAVKIILGHEFQLLPPVPMRLREHMAAQSQKWPDIHRRMTELQAIGMMDRAKMAGKIKAEQAEREMKMAEIREKSRSFNHQSAYANFEEWGKAPLWSLQEAVALSFGRDPKIVTPKEISPFVKISAFAAEYEKRHDMVWRALQAGILTNPICPSKFLAWMQRYDYAVPPKLAEVVRRFADPATPAQIAPVVADLGGATITSTAIATSEERSPTFTSAMTRRSFVSSIQRGDALRYELAEIMDRMVAEKADPRNIPSVIGRIKSSIKSGGVVVSIDDETIEYMKSPHEGTEQPTESSTIKTLRERIAGLLKSAEWE